MNRLENLDNSESPRERAEGMREPDALPEPGNGLAVTASNSQAVLAAELARTRAALRELYRVFVICQEGPVSMPFRQAAIREAGEVLGFR
jgi:hypothetical protein